MVSAPHTTRTMAQMGLASYFAQAISDALPTEEQLVHERLWESLHADVGAAKDRSLAALQAWAAVEVAWYDCARAAGRRMPQCGCGQHQRLTAEAEQAYRDAEADVAEAVAKVKAGVPRRKVREAIG